MMTYSQIRAAIKGFVLDSSEELEADLDTLIRLGELKIYREADLRVFRQHAYTSLIPGDYYLKIPTTCLVVRDLRLTNGDYLENVPESFIREYWPDPTALGTPKYYSQWDHARVLLAPTPSVGEQVEMTYTYQPPGLSVDVPTTWLSTFAEDLLLYAILVETATYKQGMIPSGVDQQYRANYDSALNRLVGQEQRNRYDEYKQRGNI